MPANNSKETDLGGSEQQIVQIKTEYRKTDGMVGISIPTVRSVEPRFNEPLLNENLDITNGILCPSYRKIYEKEPRFNDRPVPSDFVRSRFYYNRLLGMCRWTDWTGVSFSPLDEELLIVLTIMESPFQAFLIELLEWGQNFFGILPKSG